MTTAEIVDQLETAAMRRLLAGGKVQVQVGAAVVVSAPGLLFDECDGYPTTPKERLHLSDAWVVLYVDPTARAWRGVVVFSRAEADQLVVALRGRGYGPRLERLLGNQSRAPLPAPERGGDRADHVPAERGVGDRTPVRGLPLRL